MRLKLILIVDTFFRGGEEWHRLGVGILHAFDVVFVFWQQGVSKTKNNKVKRRIFILFKNTK